MHTDPAVLNARRHRVTLSRQNRKGRRSGSRGFFAGVAGEKPAPRMKNPI
jgi:hypothetical protein